MIVSLSRVALLTNTPTPFPRRYHLHLPTATTPSLAFRPWRTNKITDLPSKRQFSFSSSSMDSPPEGYRKNVGICVTNPSNKIFSASRLDIPGAWQMPQGGIDEGEDPKSAALRELREETGITSAEVVAEVPHWLTYDFPPHVKEKLDKEWGSNWKGQAQKWFLLRFTGNEEEVNLLGDGTERVEFADWSWMTPQEVIERAVSFKKPVYEEILKVFAPYLDSPSEDMYRLLSPPQDIYEFHDIQSLPSPSGGRRSRRRFLATSPSGRRRSRRRFLAASPSGRRRSRRLFLAVEVDIPEEVNFV